VLQASSGALAVLAVLYDVGASANRPLEALDWAGLHEGQSRPTSLALEARSLLPPDLDYVAYNGSLSVPPCTEGVRWLVLRARATLSQAQMDAFPLRRSYRPVQPGNARSVQRGAPFLASDEGRRGPLGSLSFGSSAEAEAAAEALGCSGKWGRVGWGKRLSGMNGAA